MSKRFTTTPIHEGGCFCGAVRYRVAGEPSSSVICHCESCRRASGAPAVAWVTFQRTCFEIVAGKPAVFHSSPGVVRQFCGTCGSALTYFNATCPISVDVTAGTLDEPDAFPPTAEIWLENRLHWQPVDPALDQYVGSTSG
ncbi:MAG: GFA family protein [Steroidobacteraceae bacterium]